MFLFLKEIFYKRNLFFSERYRDLIQAADTIAEMKETSECVVSRISAIQETFQFLQQKYLIGFKMEPDKQMLTR